MAPSELLSPVALTQTNGEVVIALGCVRQVRSVRVTTPNRDVVWAIRTDEEAGLPLERITVGVAPPGFVEVDSWNGSWSDYSVGLTTVEEQSPGDFRDRGVSRRFSASSGEDGWAHDGSNDDGSWDEYRSWVTTSSDLLDRDRCPREAG